MPEGLRRVGICLCDGIHGGSRHDLARVRSGLAELAPAAGLAVVPSLCRRPELLGRLAEKTAADRLVLGLCGSEPATTEFQSWARRAGLDPFAIELVALPEDGEAAALRLAAAAARLEAFAGSRPEQLKLRLLSEEGAVSRRALFTLPPLTYEAVASIDREKCLGERRCGLCLGACPAAAIETRDGVPLVDKPQCTACGICVTTCPVDAVGLPGSSLGQYEAEIGALLSSGPRPIAIACKRAAAELDGRGGLGPGALPVEVPCLGMVTPGWILQVLAAGAPAVALRSCGESCRFGGEAAAQARVDYVQGLLRLLGEDAPSSRVTAVGTDPAWPASDAARPQKAVLRRVTLTEPAATTQALLALAEANGAGLDGFLAHDASSLGLVELREETCTACGACTEVCPTGALVREEDAESVTISYDATLCIPCGRCVPVCPEGASDTIQVRAVTDLEALTRGRVTLKRAEVALCRKCGRPVAPTPVLGRVQELLEADGESEALFRALTELCSDCRGLSAGSF